MSRPRAKTLPRESMPAQSDVTSWEQLKDLVQTPSQSLLAPVAQSHGLWDTRYPNMGHVISKYGKLELRSID